MKKKYGFIFIAAFSLFCMISCGVSGKKVSSETESIATTAVITEDAPTEKATFTETPTETPSSDKEEATSEETLLPETSEEITEEITSEETSEESSSAYSQMQDSGNWGDLHF